MLWAHNAYMQARQQRSRHANEGATGITRGRGDRDCSKLDRHTVLFVVLKSVVQPGLLFGALVWLSFRGSVVSPAVMTTSIPAMPTVVMLAPEYGVAEGAIVFARTSPESLGRGWVFWRYW